MSNRDFPCEGMVTMRDVVEFLSVSQSSVRRMVGRGDLIARKLGPRTIRFDVGEVRRYAHNIGR